MLLPFVALAAMLLSAAGYAPDSGFDNVADYDVVVTSFDPAADLDQYTTFAVADTLLRLGDPDADGEDLPSGLTAIIVSEVESQMIGMGYTLEDDPETTPPDLVLVAGGTRTIHGTAPRTIHRG